MEKATSIRFGTVEEKKARERSDKVYRHARQRARALRKGDTPPSLLSAASSASAPALDFVILVFNSVLQTITTKVEFTSKNYNRFT